MNSTEPKLQFRLTLVACSTNGAQILTTLDASNRIRKLPSFIAGPVQSQPFEQTVRQQFGQALGENILHLEQIETSIENGIPTVDMLGLVAEPEQFRVPACDWWPLYELFPWEDWRKRAPETVASILLPALYRWAKHAEPQSQQIIANLFADHDQNWSATNLANRYDFLYRAGLLPEALRDQSGAAVSVRHRHVHVFGQTMLGQDRRQLARALTRLRQNLQTRPHLCFLVPGPFSLGTLQKAAEQITGIGLHTQNFRRDILRSNLLVSAEGYADQSMGRPAKLYTWANRLDPETSTIGIPLPRRKLRA